MFRFRRFRPDRSLYRTKAAREFHRIGDGRDPVGSLILESWTFDLGKRVGRQKVGKDRAQPAADMTGAR